MVIAGELSANEAAIEAGFRARATPLATRRRAWGKASADGELFAETKLCEKYGGPLSALRLGKGHATGRRCGECAGARAFVSAGAT